MSDDLSSYDEVRVLVVWCAHCEIVKIANGHYATVPMELHGRCLRPMRADRVPLKEFDLTYTEREIVIFASHPLVVDLDRWERADAVRDKGGSTTSQPDGFRPFREDLAGPGNDDTRPLPAEGLGEGGVQGGGEEPGAGGGPAKEARGSGATQGGRDGGDGQKEAAASGGGEAR